MNMEAKYEVGDKVRVLPRDEDKEYDAGYMRGMTKYENEVFNITHVFNSEEQSYVAYNIDCPLVSEHSDSKWEWSEDMLEPYVEENPDTDSVSGFSLYLIIGRVPGFVINTVVRVNDGEPGCYVHNQYYGPDELLPFAIGNAPQLFERIYKK